jgi:hypothetical protein
MPSCGMLLRVALVRTDVSERRSASVIRVTRIGELGTTLAVTSSVRLLLVTANVPSSSILVTLITEAVYCFETSVLYKCHTALISQKAGVNLHSHRREKLNSHKEKFTCSVGQAYFPGLWANQRP